MKIQDGDEETIPLAENNEKNLNIGKVLTITFGFFLLFTAFFGC
jgi:hypothetical protein